PPSNSGNRRPAPCPRSGDASPSADFLICAASRKVSGVGQDSSKEHAVKSALKLVSFLALFLGASASWAQEKVVYHFDGGLSQATAGIRNIYNHLEADPKVKIVAVAPAHGGLFLMEG